MFCRGYSALGGSKIMGTLIGGASGFLVGAALFLGVWLGQQAIDPALHNIGESIASWFFDESDMIYIRNNDGTLSDVIGAVLYCF